MAEKIINAGTRNIDGVETKFLIRKGFKAWQVELDGGVIEDWAEHRKIHVGEPDSYKLDQYWNHPENAEFATWLADKGEIAAW
jgi:hypothetical protein